MIDNRSVNAIHVNRLCLEFVNLPYTSGDPVAHATSWLELVEFLADKRIISQTRSEELRTLTKSDPAAAGALVAQAERLMHGMEMVFRAILENVPLQSGWVKPINEVLQVTEGHDELQWDGNVWSLRFIGKYDRLEWLLAAIARSGAELIAEGAQKGLSRCSNKNCLLLFYDDSKFHRRKWCSMALCGNRSKVAAFARRHGGGKARAQHA
jgi:predicted RNA-binding Zn ribbon-like protein